MCPCVRDVNSEHFWHNIYISDADVTNLQHQPVALRPSLDLLPIPMGNTIGSSSYPVKQDVPETWSTSFTEGDTAAHSFQVTGFSLLDGMGTGNLVSSSTFRVGDCDSDITFYPDG